MTAARKAPPFAGERQTVPQRRGDFSVICGGRVRKSSAGVALDCLRTELDAVEAIVAKLRDGESTTREERARLRVSAMRIHDVRGVLRV